MDTQRVTLGFLKSSEKIDGTESLGKRSSISDTPASFASARGVETDIVLQWPGILVKQLG